MLLTMMLVVLNSCNDINVDKLCVQSKIRNGIGKQSKSRMGFTITNFNRRTLVKNIDHLELYHRDDQFDILFKRNNFRSFCTVL